MAGLTVKTSRGASAGSTGGTASRIFGTVFLLLFLGMGLLFTVLVGRTLVATARTYDWIRGECTVFASGVEEHPGAAEADEQYRFTVTYRYEVDGRSRQGSRYRPGYAGSSDVTSARRLAAAHPFGARVPCWIDPSDPDSAVLARRSPAVVLWILLPLIFVAIGGGGLVLLWLPGRLSSGARGTAPSSPAAPLSQANVPPRWVPGCLVAFFGVFLCAGLGTSIFFVRPALQALAARSWQPTPCTILYSAVRTHSGSDSTTYNLDVLYSYFVGGREHRASRYEFMGGSSGGYDRYSAAADRYPAGSRAECYVDPADPEEAVLERGIDRQYWAAIVPVVFTLVGAGGIVFVLRGFSRSRRKAGALDWLPREAAAAAAGRREGPVELAPAGTPTGKFLGMVFVCLFWNGIVSVFLWQVVLGWRQGNRDWGLTLFLVPFVLVGLLLVWGVVYQLLALANPRPHLTLAPAALPLGAAAQLEWRFRGLAGRIHHLRITLEGREEATSTRGKSTSTDRDTFAIVEIADTSVSSSIPAGSASFSVPDGTMHSFAAPHNRIVWTLKVHGEIRGWPDVAEDFDVAVLPPEAIA